MKRHVLRGTVLLIIGTCLIHSNTVAMNSSYGAAGERVLYGPERGTVAYGVHLRTHAAKIIYGPFVFPYNGSSTVSLTGDNRLIIGSREYFVLPFMKGAHNWRRYQGKWFKTTETRAIFGDISKPYDGKEYVYINANDKLIIGKPTIAIIKDIDVYYGLHW